MNILFFSSQNQGKSKYGRLILSYKVDGGAANKVWVIDEWIAKSIGLGSGERDRFWLLKKQIGYHYCHFEGEIEGKRTNPTGRPMNLFLGLFTGLQTKCSSPIDSHRYCLFFLSFLVVLPWNTTLYRDAISDCWNFKFWGWR